MVVKRACGNQAAQQVGGCAARNGRRLQLDIAIRADLVTGGDEGAAIRAHPAGFHALIVDRCHLAAVCRTQYKVHDVLTSSFGGPASLAETTDTSGIATILAAHFHRSLPTAHLTALTAGSAPSSIRIPDCRCAITLHYRFRSLDRTTWHPEGHDRYLAAKLST